MAIGSRALVRGRAVVGGLAVLALAAAPLAAPSSAVGAPQPAPADFPACPAAVPMADVTAGTTGQGLTVVRGSTPQQFNVEVLGVLHDGIGPGRDLIVAEASDLPGSHVIDQGGIWAGMSGSPVYVGGKLLGSVSYGFSASPSPIAGITPAADMLDLLTLGAAAQNKPAATAEKVALPSALRHKIAASTDSPAPRGSMNKLPLPLALSGLNSTRVKRFQKDADAAKLSVVAYNGSGAAAPPADAPMTRPVPGGNFVAALSYGDLSAYATGTTTAVCGDQAISFGHPFESSGPTTLGASDGTSLAIIRDETFGSFKLADIGSPVGTVDQDRTAGVRTQLGVAPPATTITTTVRNGDTGRSRTGTTKAIAQDQLPDIAAYAALANFDTTFDEIGDGRATSRWTITGTRANGKAFTISRGNRWASRYDVSADPAFDLAYTIDALIGGDVEPVTITNVDIVSRVKSTFQQLRISKVEVSVNGGKYTSRDELTVKAGAKLKVRTTLKPFRSDASTTRTTSFTVPARARGQYALLSVAGGLDLASSGDDEEDIGCLLGLTSCDEDSEESFDAVLKSIKAVSRNDDLVAQLVIDASSKTKSKSETVTHKQRLTSVVAGERSVFIQVRR